MTTESLMQDAELHVAHAGPLFFVTANTPPPLEQFDALERHLLTTARRHGPVSFLMVIQPNRPNQVPPEVKERLAKMLKAIGEVCLGQAIVVDAKGLRGTIVRAFLTGLSFFTTSNGYPVKVFANTREALDWLGTLPKQDGGYETYRREYEGYTSGNLKRSA
jgi:hypothetical protein